MWMARYEGLMGGFRIYCSVSSVPTSRVAGIVLPTRGPIAGGNRWRAGWVGGKGEGEDRGDRGDREAGLVDCRKGLGGVGWEKAGRGQSKGAAVV